MGVTLGTSLDFNSFKGVNLATGTSANDAVNKTQMDTAIAAAAKASDFLPAVRVASTANVTVSSAPSTLDGVTLAAGNRVLLKNQTTGAENGAYTYASTGAALVRDTDTIGANSVWPVAEGTVNADTTWWVTTNAPITTGSTTLVISQYAASGATYTASTGLTMVGNDVRLVQPVPLSAGGTNASSASAARTSLGAVGRYDNEATALSAGIAATLTHNLGNAYPAGVTAWETGGAKRRIDLEWATVDTNSVTVKSDAAYISGALHFIVSA